MHPHSIKMETDSLDHLNGRGIITDVVKKIKASLSDGNIGFLGQGLENCGLLNKKMNGQK